jgi:hypothetical protein
MATMGYIIALVVLLVVVPLLFALLSRRTPVGGGGARQRSRGVTVAEPSSDQPAPGAEGSLNQPRGESKRELPPG